MYLIRSNNQLIRSYRTIMLSIHTITTIAGSMDYKVTYYLVQKDIVKYQPPTAS